MFRGGETYENLNTAISNKRYKDQILKKQMKVHCGKPYLANGWPFELFGIPYLYSRENKVQTFFSGSIG